MGREWLGETRKAAVWALLCRSCSVRPSPRCGAERIVTREMVATSFLVGVKELVGISSFDHRHPGGYCDDDVGMDTAVEDTVSRGQTRQQ